MLSQLDLPSRPPKPRKQGITCLIDSGLPIAFFQDAIESHHEFIDYVKFGWGTSLVTREIRKKIAILGSHEIGFFFGGTLFEKAVKDDCVDDYLDYCQDLGAQIVEVSNGTLCFPLSEKCDFIRRIGGRFTVWSEVGFKDPQRSLDFSPSRWIESIKAELDAGSKKVITESRESGTSGVCRRDGEIRYGLIEDILASGIDVEKLVFEAPNKMLQAYFVDKIGPNVNLANISFSDVVGTETLRLGLRSDTFVP